jgi:N-methylhydantoinase A
VTDADAVLGYLPVDGFASGRMALDIDAARAAIERDVAAPLGIDLIDAAWGIERIVNANMANATRKVLAGYGADPRRFAMIAYGGNGAVHAWAIARELGMGRILVPKTAPGFSALGLLVADYAVDIQKSYVTPLSQVDVTRLRTMLRELEDEATKELAPAELPADAVEQELFVQMAYPGQNFDMSVPCPEGDDLTDADLLALAERFHDQHETDRGFSFRNQEPVVRGARLVGRGHTPKPDHLGEVGAIVDVATTVVGERDAYFDDGWVTCPVIDGTQLGPGALVTGPALVQEPFTVLVVPPGATATLGDHASYELTLR